MKITLAQISVEQNLKKNLKKVIRIINENNSDLIVFPELALTSYDLEYISSLNRQNINEALNKIRLLLSSRKQTVIIGTSRYDNKGYIYNSAAIITPANIFFYDKINLTEKDKRIFIAGEQTKIFEIQNFRIGIIICRDQNDIELIKKYKEKIDLMAHLSAHYYEPVTAIKKSDKNIAIPITRAIDCCCIWTKVNTVGQNGSEISLGKSIVVSPYGEILRQSNKFSDEIITFEPRNK
jgi:predicted amidohydrolase